VPPFVLLVLKVVFLVLLYLFVWRVVRAVAVDMRRTRPAASRAPATVPSAATRAGRGRPPKSVVVTADGGAKGQTYRLDGSVEVGRSEDCDVRLSDTYASSHHARLYDRDGVWYVEDLGSTNGTYLNQRRLTGPAEVRAGDRVKIGRTVLELRR
jgi:pSer/pThr/pTyr-binding forkhead associated (FHA) protein